jgi:hypothetical protein
MIADPCTAEIRGAAGRPLTDDEVLEIAEAIQRRRRRLVADGRLDDLDRRLAAAARDEGDAAKLAAALARKHAALTIIARDRLDAQVAGHLAAGLSPRKAILAVLEGSVRGVPGARVSVAATRLAFEGRYVGEMLATIERERPHIGRALRDRRLWADAVAEMFELKEGGNPGVSGNDDARFVAETFARFAERSRTDLNRLGAAIGKLDGWAGPQVHDPYKLLKVSRDDWVRAIRNRLDLGRTLPDVDDPEEVGRILAGIYDTIVTGRDGTITARERGEVPGSKSPGIGPANLARAAGRHRVLHFRSAADWLAYQAEFGQGNLLSAMIAHQGRAARLAAQMQVLGPNPDALLGALLENLGRRLSRDERIPHAERGRIVAALKVDGTQIGAALAEARGLTLAPVDVRLAEIGSGIRAVQAMAKLGGAVLSAVTGDVVTGAANLRFQGMPLFAAYHGLLHEMLRGRGRGQAREVAFLVGEGFDGLIDAVVSPYVAGDGAPGWLGRRLVDFFRWSGLSGQADVMRAAGARMVAAWLGANAGHGWDALPAALRHTLGLHGIDAPRWEAVRGTAWTADNGTTYLTPERIAGLPDAAVEDLIAADPRAGEPGEAEVRAYASRRGRPAGSAPRAGLTDAQQARFDGWRARRIDRARLELELAFRGYLADEVSFGHVETDAASRRLALQGTRPGTPVGEALRFVMQFKGFPIAFTQRVLGRALYGGPAGARLGKTLHVGHLIAGLTVAGYLSMTAKDVVRGYEPRQPETAAQWAKVIGAAMVQGGGAGIYGDFLFGEANRFGGGVLGTAAGPAVGTGAQLIELWQKARQGDARAADALALGLQNAPGLNLFYLRPALDTLVLSALHESLSPGWLERQARRRRKDYGQDRLWEPLQ